MDIINLSPDNFRSEIILRIFYSIGSVEMKKRYYFTQCTGNASTGILIPQEIDLKQFTFILKEF